MQLDRFYLRPVLSQENIVKKALADQQEMACQTNFSPLPTTPSHLSTSPSPANLSLTKSKFKLKGNTIITSPKAFDLGF